MTATLRAVLTALAGAAIAWACGGTATSDDLFGKVPLARCGSECADELECIEGVCTKACEDDSDCSSISATATCASAGSDKACDVGCSSDGDCRELDGDYECADGNCRAVTNGSGSSDGGTAGGGSAGGGSGGGAGSGIGTTTTCELPMEAGPCEAAFERWWFNSKSGACEQFTYGGCQGNDNNFESLGACKGACGGGGEECGCCDCRPKCAGGGGRGCEAVDCKPCAPPPECSCDAMCAGRKLPLGCAVDCKCPTPACPPLEGFCERACSEPLPDIPAGCPVPKCACVDPGCPSPDAYCKAACNGEPLPKTPDGCAVPSCACPPIDYCARGFPADPSSCPVMVKELCFKSTDDACRCAGCEPDACAILESAPAQVACGK